MENDQNIRRDGKSYKKRFVLCRAERVNKQKRNENATKTKTAPKDDVVTLSTFYPIPELQAKQGVLFDLKSGHSVSMTRKIDLKPNAKLKESPAFKFP